VYLALIASLPPASRESIDEDPLGPWSTAVVFKRKQAQHLECGEI
jgi:hypothetical protein